MLKFCSFLLYGTLKGRISSCLPQDPTDGVKEVKILISTLLESCEVATQLSRE